MRIRKAAAEAGVEDPTAEKTPLDLVREKVSRQAIGGPLALSRALKTFCRQMRGGTSSSRGGLESGTTALDFGHFKAALQFCKINVKYSHLHELFTSFDRDGSGLVSEEEFLVGVYGYERLQNSGFQLSEGAKSGNKRARRVAGGVDKGSSRSNRNGAGEGGSSRSGRNNDGLVGMFRPRSVDPVATLKSKLAQMCRTPGEAYYGREPAEALSLAFRRYVNAKVKVRGSQQHRLGINRVSEDTFRSVMDSLGMSNPILVEKLFRKFDARGEGALHYPAFVGQLYPVSSNHGEQAVRMRIAAGAGERKGGVNTIAGALDILRRLVQNGRCRGGPKGMQEVFRQLCTRAALRGENKEASVDLPHFRAALHRCGVPVSPELAKFIFEHLDTVRLHGRRSCCGEKKRRREKREKEKKKCGFYFLIFSSLRSPFKKNENNNVHKRKHETYYYLYFPLSFSYLLGGGKRNSTPRPTPRSHLPSNINRTSTYHRMAAARSSTRSL